MKNTKLFTLSLIVCFITVLLTFATNSRADTKMDTVLLEAVVAGDLESTLNALENGASADARGANQTSALTLATFDENLLIVIKLLDWGADVNAVNDFKQTALMSALRFGHNEVVKVLLWRGADVSMVDEDGYTALFFAWASDNLEGMEILKKHLEE